MSIDETETELTEAVLNTWKTPNQKRIENFLATTALQRLGELEDIDL